MDLNRQGRAGASGGGGRLRGRGAFTLVELLTVVAVVALLLAVLVPTLDRAREHAYSAICKSNLGQLWDTFHSSPPNRPLSLPPPAGWVAHVYDRGAGGVMNCPKDPGRADAALGLEGVYIDHFHLMSVHLHAYLVDALEPGAPLGSGDLTQVSVNHVSDTVKEIFLFGSNGLRITFGSSIVIQAIPDPEWYRCNSTSTNSSTHNLMKGETLLMNMLGVDNLVAAVPPTVVLGSNKVSYGMNNQVPGLSGRADQVLLLDYPWSIVDVDGKGNNDDDLNAILPIERHLGKVNVLRVDGSCRSASPWQLQPAEDVWKP